MKYLLIIATAMLLFAACGKPPVVTPNREGILRAKKWRITDGTITVRKPNGKDTALKYRYYVDTCYLDDYISFDSMHFGKAYTNSDKCNPADPEFRNFTWRLHSNERYIDLYDGFNMIFAVTTSIQPYRFDTSFDPYKLDTLIGRLDTIPGFYKEFIVLDTIRELRYTRYPIPYNYDLMGAEITDFSELSFKLHFSFRTTRLDSTNFHAGAPNNFPPILVNDTADYNLTFSSY